VLVKQSLFGYLPSAAMTTEGSGKMADNIDTHWR